MMMMLHWLWWTFVDYDDGCIDYGDDLGIDHGDYGDDIGIYCKIKHKDLWTNTQLTRNITQFY